jgi:hypothetical protein
MVAGSTSLRRGELHSFPLRIGVDGLVSRYVETKILSKEAFDHVKSLGVEFATLADAGDCLLKIVSNKQMNGHSLFLSPRKWAPRGYFDMGLDDYEDALLQEITRDQLKGSEAEEKLFL